MTLNYWLNAPDGAFSRAKPLANRTGAFIPILDAPIDTSPASRIDWQAKIEQREAGKERAGNKR